MNGFKEKFRNMPVSKKLLISHGVIIVSTFVLIATLLICLKITAGHVDAMYEGPVTNAFYIGDIRVGTTDIQRGINLVMAMPEEQRGAAAANLEKEMAETTDKMRTAYVMLKERLLTDKGREILEELFNVLSESTEHREKVLELLKAGSIYEAYLYNENQYKPLIEEVSVLADELDQIIYSAGENYGKESNIMANIMLVIGIALLILITSIAVWLTRLVTTGISEPVHQITEAAKSMRVGDLSVANTITYEAEDELGVLAQTLRETITTLDGYVVEISGILQEMAKGDLTQNFTEITDYEGDFKSIKDSFVLILKSFNETLVNILKDSTAVDAGSDEIASAANDLASGTGEQAGAVEELTATINSVSDMAMSSAEQARSAYDRVLKSVKVAESERAQMQNLQDEMQKIKEISGEIETIITAIEEIASQTSLLSLNASIEAARAGEAGRGFAVVADQIGKLATDSAQSVVNTKALIEKTVEEIEKGNKITKETAAAFENIIEEMQGFAAITKDVNENAANQAEALRQVEAGIEQISGVTQSNAAASEECSAISEELAARASELDTLINKFKLYAK